MSQRKKYLKLYYEKNRELINKRQRRYRQLNNDKMKNNNEKYKKYRKQYYKNYAKNRRKIDLSFKLEGILRCRFKKALKTNSKSSSTLQLLGCSIPELKIYLENQFKPGMTWENHGLWHIDHIIPCCSFNLSLDEEQKKCFHYSNLQPLWAEENLKKGGRMIK